MENLILAINCVLPVFLVICAGTLIRRSNKVPEQTFPSLSTLAFQFLLPCMLFHSTYTTDLSAVFDPKLMGFLVVFVLLWFGLGFVLCTRFVPDHRARGVFIQDFFRSNIGVVGVTMAESMMGDAGVAAMAMIIAILVPIYNVLAVVTLEVCRGGEIHLRPTLVSIAKNPLIIGCVSGLALMLLDIPIPASVLKGVDLIGDAGSVVTLLALGASFQFAGLHKNLKKVVFANLLRLVISPAVALTAALLLGFRGNDLSLVLLVAAPSLATTSFPMALARGSDHELTGHVVVTTSFFCCFTLFLWIFGLGQAGLL